LAKKAAKKPTGRPLKHSAAQAQKLIDEYFQNCQDTKTPCTITGLALALDTSRQALCNWIERPDELGAVIKRAKVRVENYVEELLLSSRSPGGPIFWLKNFGWSDRQELNLSGGMDVDVHDPGREKLTDADLKRVLAILRKTEGD